MARFYESLRGIVTGTFEIIVCTESLRGNVDSSLEIIVCTQSLRGIGTGALEIFLSTKSLRRTVRFARNFRLYRESTANFDSYHCFILYYYFVYFSASVSLFPFFERYFRFCKWHLSKHTAVCLVSAKQAFPQPYTVC